MIPYSDDNPTSRFPVVTVSIIAINVIVFIASVALLDYEGVIRQYGLVPGNIQAVDLITSMFLHGGIMHILSNMWYMWIFGDNVEDLLGIVFFPIFYLLCGLFAHLAHILSVSGSDAMIPTIGASGAISGMLGAYIVLFPRAKVRCFYFFFFHPQTFKLDAFWFLLIWIGLQVLNSAAGGSSNVAYMAHIGGFVFGAGSIFIALKTGMISLAQREFLPADSMSLRPPSQTAQFAGKVRRAIAEGKSTAPLADEFRTLASSTANPRFAPQDWYLIGNVMEKRGENALAMYAYRKLAELHPHTNAALRANLKLAGLILKEERDPMKAAGYVQTVLRSNPDEATAAEARTLLQKINMMMKGR